MLDMFSSFCSRHKFGISSMLAEDSFSCAFVTHMFDLWAIFIFTFLFGHIKSENLALMLTCYYYCREVLSAPVRRIDEILALPHSADDFKHQQLPPSDDDSWLYGGEDEINAALKDREKEMELYNSAQKKKHKSKEHQEGVSASKEDYDEYDLGGIAKSMEAFVEKISSYEGAEVPEDRFILSFSGTSVFLNLVSFFSSYVEVRTQVSLFLAHTGLDGRHWLFYNLMPLGHMLGSFSFLHFFFFPNYSSVDNSSQHLMS